MAVVSGLQSLVAVVLTMDLFNIPPEEWWDGMRSLAANIAASDVTEDANGSLLGYPPSPRFAGI